MNCPIILAFHIASAHDTSLQDAMELGRGIGAHLPEDVLVVGIAVESIHEFSDDLSPPVAQVVPFVVNIVLDLLKEITTEETPGPRIKVTGRFDCCLNSRPATYSTKRITFIVISG
ncbi:MAG: hypothetical protein MZV49_25270 [Rhodopseudomonas palustris]|nr:hypothetical protein [Rhodopseudomonas palustris]